MAEKVLIIKYGEIAMRGNNRYLFINRLISAIRRNIDPFGTVSYTHLRAHET